MTNDELHDKVIAHDGCIERHEGRIKALEHEIAEQRKLVTSVAVIAEQLKTMNEKIDNITTYIEDERDQPKKRWEKILEGVLKAIGAAIGGGIIGAVVMYFLAK